MCKKENKGSIILHLITINIFSHVSSIIKTIMIILVHLFVIFEYNFFPKWRNKRKQSINECSIPFNKIHTAT